MNAVIRQWHKLDTEAYISEFFLSQPISKHEMKERVRKAVTWPQADILRFLLANGAVETMIDRSLIGLDLYAWRVVANEHLLAAKEMVKFAIHELEPAFDIHDAGDRLSLAECVIYDGDRYAKDILVELGLDMSRVDFAKIQRKRDAQNKSLTEEKHSSRAELPLVLEDRIAGAERSADGRTFIFADPIAL